MPHPSTFPQEQVAAILALACEEPGQLGLPFNHWAPSQLKAAAIYIHIGTADTALFLKMHIFSQTAKRKILRKI